jgi:hypothetical protein
MYDQYAMVPDNSGGGAQSLPTRHTEVAVTPPARPVEKLRAYSDGTVSMGQKAALYEGDDPSNPNGT